MITQVTNKFLYKQHFHKNIINKKNCILERKKALRFFKFLNDVILGFLITYL